MSVKISELQDITLANLLVTANTSIPVVSDVSGDKVTYRTSVADVKSYIETGNLSVTGSLSVDSGSTFNNVLINGILTTINPQVSAGSQSLNTSDSILDIHYQQNAGTGNVNVSATSKQITGDGTGNLRAILSPGYTIYVGGNIAGVISNVGSNISANLVANSLVSANTASFTYLIPVDDGKSVGVRMNYYKSDYDQAALIWDNSTRRLVWYGNGVGSATTGTISPAATLGEMHLGSLLIANTTPTTGTYTGALQVNGGAYIGGAMYVGGSITSVFDITTANITALDTVVSALRSTSTISAASSATLNSLAVNNGATINTTLVSGGNATVNALTVNNSVTVGTTFRSTAGIQNTPIGNVTPSTGAFTTVSVTTGITTTGNATANIGSSGNQFNTIFAKATSAQYADLAEKYIADADYEPGTVVIFGGSAEITVTDLYADNRVAGVVSTDPAYLMNGLSDGLPIALRGKVPVKVVGAVNKGDLLVTSTQPGYAESVGFRQPQPYTVVAKSLETSSVTGPRTIIAVIL